MRIIKFSPDERLLCVQYDDFSVGLELYQVNAEKKSVKLLKSHNISMHWFVYYPYSQLLVVSSGASSALLNPFVIQVSVVSFFCCIF
ncbi:unnamed protein product [Gongylonema pulchrum]|uniref:ANAPC4_WD40 domain-containing protein n=1 Tax=Gongylonema pulchrum TaxID=637853 RepID=A0A183EZ55_9BILA|nr:unnamed protein product [Gongylonema pulchrum]